MMTYTASGVNLFHPQALNFLIKSHYFTKIQQQISDTHHRLTSAVSAIRTVHIKTLPWKTKQKTQIMQETH